MAENYQSSHLTTSDIAQKSGEERGKPDGERGHQELNTGEDRPSQLLTDTEAEQLRDRWNVIQTEFVDDPRTSVAAADSLVAQVMRQLAEKFDEERQCLESQWQRGQQVSTEDLRLALQHYRSFSTDYCPCSKEHEA